MKKALLLTVMTVAVLAMVAVPAFAEGYNYGGYNWTEGTDLTVYGESAGIYVRSALGDYQIESDKGPHGGYNTTTNKCQDCHSTHYATGSYMLLRANSREDACTFCHGGGGGSSINIQMDNAYDADGVIASDGNFRGTGHTLGYSGGAPADIEPAFTETAGLACFNCHSPHGNSARTLGTVGNPGAAMDVWDASFGAVAPYNGVVTQIWTGGANVRTIPSETVLAAFRITDGGPFDGMYDLNKLGGNTTWPTTIGVAPINIWGKSPWMGNVVFRRGGAGGNPVDSRSISRPIFPDNKWLLVKNPNVKLAEKDITVFSWERTRYDGGIPYRGKVTTLSAGDEVPNTVIGFFFNTTTGDVYTDSAANVNASLNWSRDPDRVYLEGHFTEAAVNALADDDAAWMDIHADGVNKLALDWDNPLGPADTSYGPDQDIDRNQPYMWADMGTPARGFAAVSGFCSDCHAGSAGASTQKAKVWLPESSVESTYVVAYSHDANPRH